MKYEILHVKDLPDEYLVIVNDESTAKQEEWCVERVVMSNYLKLNPFHKTQSSSWVRKVIAHVPLYYAKPLDGVPLLPEPTSSSYCKVTMDINTLSKIFNAGFNLGSNEGPFPKSGTFDPFHNTIEGKPMTDDDNSYYAIKDKIKIASIPKEFFYEGVRTNKETQTWFGKYTF